MRRTFLLTLCLLAASVAWSQTNKLSKDILALPGTAYTDVLIQFNSDPSDSHIKNITDKGAKLKIKFKNLLHQQNKLSKCNCWNSQTRSCTKLLICLQTTGMQGKSQCKVNLDSCKVHKKLTHNNKLNL